MRKMNKEDPKDKEIMSCFCNKFDNENQDYLGMYKSWGEQCDIKVGDNIGIEYWLFDNESDWSRNYDSFLNDNTRLVSSSSPSMHNKTFELGIVTCSIVTIHTGENIGLLYYGDKSRE